MVLAAQARQIMPADEAFWMGSWVYVDIAADASVRDSQKAAASIAVPSAEHPLCLTLQHWSVRLPPPQSWVSVQGALL